MHSFQQILWGEYLVFKVEMIENEIQKVFPANLIERESIMEDITNEVERWYLCLVAYLDEAVPRVYSVLGVLIFNDEVLDFPSDLLRRSGLPIVFFKISTDHILFIHGLSSHLYLTALIINFIFVRWSSSQKVLKCFLMLDLSFRLDDSDFLRDIHVLLAGSRGFPRFGFVNELNLFLGYVLVLETLIINDVPLPIDYLFPLFRVLVHQVLNLETYSARQKILGLAVREKTL